MKILEGLVQGSDKWKAVRGKYHVASEASMVMDCHANVSRAELVRMKALGTEQEFTEWVERNILDKGHAIEAATRPIVEGRIGEELYPVVAVDDTDRYLASFDGITMMEDTVWECKQHNQSKAASVNNQQVPECDYWQVVHQLMVSGAEKAIYTVSDGTLDGVISVELKPNKADFEKLQAAWEQFEQDVANYEHKPVKEKPKGNSEVNLPALHVELSGAVSASNLPVFKDQVMQMIDSINTELVTDEDFSNAEATVKALTAGEKALEDAKAKALAQTVSIDELFSMIDSLKSEMRDKRLVLTKLVKTEKDQRRAEEVDRGATALRKHIESINESFTGKIKLPQFVGNFAQEIKGKKTMQSIANAIDSELARCKIEASKQAELLRKNIEVLNSLGAEYKFLFSDAAEIVLKATDDLEAVIKSRIADHKQREEEKLEAERERIRQEEARKVQIEASNQQAEQIKQAQQQEPVTKPVDQPLEGYSHIPESKPDQMLAEETVTITRTEYNNLLLAQELLNALQAAGVDNWNGYSDAMEILNAA